MSQKNPLEGQEKIMRRKNVQVNMMKLRKYLTSHLWVQLQELLQSKLSRHHWRKKKNHAVFCTFLRLSIAGHRSGDRELKADRTKYIRMYRYNNYCHSCFIQSVDNYEFWIRISLSLLIRHFWSPEKWYIFIQRGFVVFGHALRCYMRLNGSGSCIPLEKKMFV